VGKRFTDYEELLRDPEIEIVHINTPPLLHAVMPLPEWTFGP